MIYPIDLIHPSSRTIPGLEIELTNYNHMTKNTWSVVYQTNLGYCYQEKEKVLKKKNWEEEKEKEEGVQ